MSKPSQGEDLSLATECRAFSAYLIGREPDDYICTKYCEAHQVPWVIRQDRSDSFDRFIIRFARRGLTCARMADAYTRWFYRKSALRRKFLLLMAIIECAGSSFSIFEADRDRSKIRLYLSFLFKGASFVMYLAASLIFFSAAYPVVKSPAIIGWHPEVKRQWEKS